MAHPARFERNDPSLRSQIFTSLVLLNYLKIRTLGTGGLWFFGSFWGYF
jgi:hypothetical protein